MTDREIWFNAMYKMASPILENMSCGQLKHSMRPVYSPIWDGRDRGVAYMEAFGRMMAGIAPWLALQEHEAGEKILHDKLYNWALQSYTHAVNSESPDYLLWNKEWQPLVDAAYIAHSFLRGYKSLWLVLDDKTKRKYIHEFKGLRRVTPPYNNWILYPAIIEVFLMVAGEIPDFYRIDTAIRTLEGWYVGDGWYSDGPTFAFDYYNSFVIHPMYIECLETLVEFGYSSYICTYVQALKRMQRYGCILERMISPEGYFPVFGRSATYRTAVFQPLSMLALNQQLPQSLSNGQVRSALTKVIENMFASDANFDERGYLVLGFNGYQPEIADYYTNTGSLYIASLIFLPLGLPVVHPFWQDEAMSWTMKKAWQKESFSIDGKW